MIESPQQVIVQLKERLALNTSTLIEGDYLEAAVLVAVTEGSGEPELILTRRAAHLNIHPGEAAFPGGKKDVEDESLLATALREAREEVGLGSGDFSLFGRLDQRLTRTNIKVSAFVGSVSEDVALSANLDELDCIYKVPLSFFLDPDHLFFADKSYQGSVRRVPHFTYQQHSIWGVTALIIVDLMNSVFDAGLRES